MSIPIAFFTPAMEISQRGPWSLLRPLLLVLGLNVILPTQALYFYLDGASASPKCFYEELPKDTLVVGELPSPAPVNTIISNLPYDRPLQRPRIPKQRLQYEPRPLHHRHRRRSLRQRPPRRQHQRLPHG